MEHKKMCGKEVTMRAIFMGTPDFAVSTLERVVEAGHEVIAVYSQPDKPKGRGKAMQPTPVKEKALELGIPVYQPARVKEEAVIEEIRALNPEVIIVVAFGQILPKAILDIPKYGCVNVHGSLLPKYRGAAPIQWSIIDGEEETGVTTMLMDVGCDTGDMLMKAKTPISSEDTGGSLFDRLAGMGADLLVETLVKLEEGSIVPEKQDDSLANYAKMLSKSTGHIDFTKTAVEIERLIRGLNPWPSAYTSLDGKTLKIWKASVKESEKKAEPGQVVNVTKDSIEIQTGEGILSLEELQLEGKKRMTADAFLRGYSLEQGTILGN